MFQILEGATLFQAKNGAFHPQEWLGIKDDHSHVLLEEGHFFGVLHVSFIVLKPIKEVETEGTVVGFDDVGDHPFSQYWVLVFRLPVIQVNRKVAYDAGDVILHLHQRVAGSGAFCNIMELSEALAVVNDRIEQLVIIRCIPQESISVRDEEIDNRCYLRKK